MDGLLVWSLAVCLELVLATAGWAAAAEKQPPAELAIRGAQVLTMDAALPTASAVAVRNGEIVYVGDDAGVAEFIGPHTRVVADPAVTVLPGLMDAHGHMSGLGLSLEQLDLRGDRSPAAIIEKVRQAAQAPMPTLESEWVIGRGWDQNGFTPARLPTHVDLMALDAATGGRPVLLRRIDGHAIWANSEAMRRAGIDLSSHAPGDKGNQPVPGGLIMRGPDGWPTGVLIDNAMALIERIVPPPRPEQLEAAILRAAAYVTSRGLTAVHDMGISPVEVEIYHRLAQSGRLPLRVFAFHEDPIPMTLAQFPHSASYREEVNRLTKRFGNPEVGPLFTLRGIKLYMDGALGSRGAALTEPYTDDPSSSGLLLAPPEHIEEMARWALLHGYQIATHAIGDRAVHLVLNAYAHAGVHAEHNLRFRVEHAQVLLPSEITGRRFAELGVIASVQPSHATSDMAWAEARLGPARLANAYAWRSLLRSGARICAGSDFPVEEADPRLILHAAVTRTNSNGQPAGGFMPEQRLTLGEAIRAMTADAAYAVFAEDQLGQLRVGRPADMTVLAGTLSLDATAQRTPPDDLLRRQVLLTVVGGQVVYDGIARTGKPAKAPAKAPAPHRAGP